MPLELSDLVAHNDGNEEEVKQLVSQWMCDICRDFTTPQFSNPVVTQCFFCNAFLCKSCAETFRIFVNGQQAYPRTCIPCWIRTGVSESDEGSDSCCSDGSRSRSRSPSSRSRSRSALPRYR